ncbi:hypothetical protein TorRG33x02_290740 [Trema orientale]|uniref:Uncharacterized protein n=1 Tax=Trema orientale TaxID=63057 RepID=A0A2P5CC05_TREOI|nr:hypothetical protein TorRG33x02_290740 [Trema orientale]
MLEDMRRKKIRNNPPPPPPPQEEVAGDLDAEERDLLDEAIKESLQTHEIEEKKSQTENYKFFQACLDSFQSYELEQKRHQEGSSSRYNYEILNKTDYYSDLSLRC